MRQPDTLATKLFDDGEQRRFARLSGDRNPMHMDPVAARRTQAGRPVVHGMHAVLWALDEMARAGLLTSRVSRVKARFTTVIYVGDVVGLSVTLETGKDLRAQLTVAGRAVTSLTVSQGGRSVNAPAGDFREVQHDCAWPEQPIEFSLHELGTIEGALRFAEPPSAAATAFPAAAGNIGAIATSGLACLSRLVGMACPGLHSILASVDVEIRADGTQDEVVHYRVDEVDDRFRLVKQAVSGGGLLGAVEAFARIPPVNQPSVEELSRRVTPNEFAGHSALILGGSRGIGEVCAKLIAAGGGRTVITYAVGAAEALCVRDEIRAFGGECETMSYDVRNPADVQLVGMSAPDSLYYCATAPIFTRRTALYSSAIYAEVHRFYVQGFYEVCVELKARNAKPLSALYPSSIAVIERPADMTEYAMAKAAGETLCADMMRFMPGIRIAVPRLPRMLTDQTATVTPVEASAPADVLPPIVREVERAVAASQRASA